MLLFVSSSPGLTLRSLLASAATALSAAGFVAAGPRASVLYRLAQDLASLPLKLQGKRLYHGNSSENRIRK